MQDSTTATDCATHAAELAAAGLPVFPTYVGPPDENGKREKRPLTKRGHRDATTDRDTVERWWREYPDAVPGVPTGSPSGLAVVDIDPEGAEWAAEHADWLAVAGRVHHTGRTGGRHYLYRHVDGARNSAGQIASGVDVRGEGGWIVWWPAAGADAVGEVEDVAAPPEALAELMCDPKGTRTNPTTDTPGTVHTAAAGSHEAIAEGQRNATLARIAGAMRRQGLDGETIGDALEAVNARRCSPPLAADEVRRIATGMERYTPERDEPPEPVDLFTESPVPRFPSEVLPRAWRRYTESVAAASGFDRGAYEFALLVHAGCILDHRTRADVTRDWSEPPFHWAALVDDSGGGKSPVLRAAGDPAMRVYRQIIQETKAAYAKWCEEYEQAAKGEKPEPPTWRQRHVDDTTVEAAADLVAQTPEGVTVTVDELTGWLGRMDAYSAGSASKDRPAWIDAWSGQRDRPINRATRRPLIVEHWAAGVIGGIQPEILAKQFRKGQGAGDGLLQRFMLYKMQPAGEPDLLAASDMTAESAVRRNFEALANMSGHPAPRFQLDRDALEKLQDYLGAVRSLQQRTSAPRFGEHLGKLPAFAVRVALTLHCVDAAADGRQPGETIAAETMARGIEVVRVLYRHSESVYAVIDQESAEVETLARSAAEAILAHGWQDVRRGDLTRQATGWRGADPRDAEAAVDVLIELGWWRDVTDEPTGRRGRRADGRWVVNPRVHELFESRAKRVAAAREERRQAVTKAAAARRNG